MAGLRVNPRNRWRGAGTALAATLVLAACVSGKPLEVSSQFEAPRAPAWDTSKSKDAGSGGICRLKLSSVDDLRPDPQSLGTVNGQAVRTTDMVGWLRSALETLNRDTRIHLAGEAEASDLALRAELVKAYVINVTGETRSINVVVRVHYGNGTTALDDQIYRGTDNGVTWGGGEGESQSSFNIALAQIVDEIHRDVVARCSSKA